MSNKHCLVKLRLLICHLIQYVIKMFRIIFRILKLYVYKVMWVLTLVILIWSWNRKCHIKIANDAMELNSNPVILWRTYNFPGTSTTRKCSRTVICDIYSNDDAVNQYDVGAFLFYGSNIDIKDLPFRDSKIIWGLYHEESPRNLEVLMHEPMLKLFNFSATFSRYSDVPFPLQYLEQIEDIISTRYFVPTFSKNSLLYDIAPVMYLQSDCETSTERDDYVKELMKFIQIDSYGACLKNKEIPEKFKGDYLNNLNEDSFLNFVSRYKFVVAIENGICNDYVTEKFWRAIKVGSVPIYFGSPSIKDWFPNNKSAILLDDFPTPEVLSKHIKKLLANDTLYEEYLEHKTKKIITNKRLINEYYNRPYQSDGVLAVHKFECFICEKLHNKSNIGVNIVNKQHYNCPKPVSALTLDVNPSNPWVYSWNYANKEADQIYKMLTSE